MYGWHDHWQYQSHCHIFVFSCEVMTKPDKNETYTYKQIYLNQLAMSRILTYAFACMSFIADMIRKKRWDGPKEYLKLSNLK